MHIESILEPVLLFFLCAISIVPVTQRLGLGPVVGYLIAGLIVGPSGLKVVDDPVDIMHFSELGVVFLLFLIGLELEPKRLWNMRTQMLGLGGLQVVLSCIVLYGLFAVTGIVHSIEAWIIALSIAFSSTEIALQILNEKNLLKAVIGQRSLAILLFQDIIVIFVLAFLPLLQADIPQAEETHKAPLWIGFLVLIVFMVLGHFLLNPFFRMISRVRLREVFLATTLFIVLGAAYLFQVSGLSLALGSFLSGVLLAESEFRRQLESDIEPFKGLLLGLFFMSVGMSIELQVHEHNFVSIILIAFGILFLKMMILRLMSQYIQLANADRWFFSILLSQGGQFAFVLIGQAALLGLVSRENTNLFYAVVAFTMILTPIGVLLHKYIFRERSSDEEKQENIQGSESSVVIIGYGRFGQIIGRILDSIRVPLVLLDHDASHVKTIREFGTKAYYGEALRLDLLQNARVQDSKAVVVAIDDQEAAVACVKLLRKEFEGLLIYARARNRSHYIALKHAGANFILRETFDSSLRMAEEILSCLGHSAEKRKEIVELFKKYDEKLLEDSVSIIDDRSALIQLTQLRCQDLMEELLRHDKLGKNLPPSV